MFYFYKRRLGKILWPTLIWSLFYLGVSVVIGRESISNAGLSLLSIPFSAQGNGILWFMYTLTGLYLIAPIISPWLKNASKKEIEFVLALWGITLCYPFLKLFFKIDETETGILYSFFGYAGYFILGHYIQHFKPKVHPLLLLAMIIVPMGVAVTCKISGAEVDFFSMFWYLSVLVVLMCFAIYLIIKDIGDWVAAKNSQILSLTSNLSFGVYLSHLFFMRSVVWKIPFVSRYGGIFQILLTIVLTIIFSYSFCWFLSKTPIGKYVLGYKNKK